MDIFQPKITYDVQNRTISAQRPNTLLLSASAKGSTFDAGLRHNPPVKKKRCKAADAKVKRFNDLYESTGETLGEGSFGHVNTYRNVATKKEFAVKLIMKADSSSRHRVLKEIEIFHHCQGHDNILQMVEYFEEDDRFYLIFEKMEGGTLLDCILKRGHLSEREASRVARDIASGLAFLHKKGIAHRDLKPENILCARAGRLTPVKICDFDLGSGLQTGNGLRTPVTTPELLSPVGSADFMAPEVVDVWQYLACSYDKRCDLWSLGIIIYILLCGYRPFYAHCKRNCDFDRGGECDDCQDLMFRCIQEGVYSFPDPDWSDISHDAKDLIRHLLVKNPYQRYTAEQVLQHTWLTRELNATTPLATPYMLSRNNTVKELSMFAETANAVNRLIQQHLSINDISSARTPVYSDDPVTGFGSPPGFSSPNNQKESGTMDALGMFQLNEVIIDIEGDMSEEEADKGRRLSRFSEAEYDLYGAPSDEDLTDHCKSAPDLTDHCKSAPTNQQCAARRQAFQVKHLSECSVDSGNVSVSSSPPDY